MSYGSVLVIYESTLETSGVDPNLFLGGEIFFPYAGGGEPSTRMSRTEGPKTWGWRDMLCFLYDAILTCDHSHRSSAVLMDGMDLVFNGLHNYIRLL